MKNNIIRINYSDDSFSLIWYDDELKKIFFASTETAIGKTIVSITMKEQS